MKTNGTRIMLISLLLYFLLVLMSYSAIAQPDYDFTNKSLVSGTDRQTGAVYRFTSVKPGVDALVTITGMTSGIVLSDIDGGSGFAEAFQPVITVSANTSAYVEFKIDFVVAGTSTPMVMTEVPATCIDVDGKVSSGNKVYEFDMISLAPASYINYDQAGGELQVVPSPGWVTGTNTAAIDYAGVDTVARQVMFTAVSASISTMTIRVGADNQTSSSQQRLRSVYFKKFTYANAFLAMPVLEYFRGARQGQNINLSCGLSNCASLARIVIERGTNYNDLKEIGEIWVNNEQVSGTYTYSDQPDFDGTSYYRIKLIGIDEEIQYSQVIVIRGEAVAAANSFQVYPTVLQSTGNLSFDAAQSTQALVQIVDFNGRLIQQQNWQLQQGRNTMMLSGAERWSQGQYIAVLKVNGQIYQQKIIRQ